MEFETGNITGPVGRAFDQHQIDTVQQVTGWVIKLIYI